jgi:sigma-70-like protein
MNRDGPGCTNRRDLDELLHEEINRLPGHARMAVVLCVLQGRSTRQAARDLGWPVATLCYRLSRALRYIRMRVVAHGLRLPPGYRFVDLLHDPMARVPRRLIESTVAAATRRAQVFPRASGDEGEPT